jgi:hypothetical protein
MNYQVPGSNSSTPSLEGAFSARRPELQLPPIAQQRRAEVMTSSGFMKTAIINLERAAAAMPRPNEENSLADYYQSHPDFTKQTQHVGQTAASSAAARTEPTSIVDESHTWTNPELAELQSKISSMAQPSAITLNNDLSENIGVPGEHELAPQTASLEFEGMLADRGHVPLTNIQNQLTLHDDPGAPATPASLEVNSSSSFTPINPNDLSPLKTDNEQSGMAA